MLPELKSVTVDGRAVAYRDAGAGPPALLLHGIGSGSASWEGQFDGLGGALRVVAWDAPGYGGSDPLTDETPAAADYARAARGLLDGLDIAAVHLVGHSLGSVIASSFCARYPDRLLSVTLADATPGYGKADDEQRVVRRDARIRAIRELGPSGMAENRSKQVLSPDASPEAHSRVKTVMSALRVDGYCQAARMLHAADAYDDLATIAAPAQVMCGGADTVTPEALNRRIAEAIPGASYRTLDGLGHASYVENPAVFNAALLDFIAGQT